MEDLIGKATGAPSEVREEPDEAWLLEFSLLRDEIRADQAEIRRLKTETRNTLARIEARLDEMEASGLPHA